MGCRSFLGLSPASPVSLWEQLVPAGLNPALHKPRQLGRVFFLHLDTRGAKHREPPPVPGPFWPSGKGLSPTSGWERPWWPPAAGSCQAGGGSGNRGAVFRLTTFIRSGQESSGETISNRFGAERWIA